MEKEKKHINKEEHHEKHEEHVKQIEKLELALKEEVLNVLEGNKEV